MCKHVCLSKYIGKTIFVDFSIFYRILFQSKRPSFKSQFFCSRLQPSRLVDLSSRLGLKSVDRLGRPTCTDVHALTWQVAGRPTRSTVQRALLSGKAPVDRPVDRTESSALCIWPRSTDRLTDGTTVWNMTVGRSTGRSTDRPDRPQRLLFQTL